MTKCNCYPNCGNETTNEELLDMIQKFASWPDQHGVDVPIISGVPLLGIQLQEWIKDHIEYSASFFPPANEGKKIAAFGFALILAHNSLECGFTWPMKANS